MVNKYYINGYVEALKYINSYIQSLHPDMVSSDFQEGQSVVINEIENHIHHVTKNYVELFDKLKDKK